MSHSTQDPKRARDTSQSDESKKGRNRDASPKRSVHRDSEYAMVIVPGGDSRACITLFDYSRPWVKEWFELLLQCQEQEDLDKLSDLYYAVYMFEAGDEDIPDVVDSKAEPDLYEKRYRLFKKHFPSRSPERDARRMLERFDSGSLRKPMVPRIFYNAEA